MSDDRDHEGSFTDSDTENEYSSVLSPRSKSTHNMGVALDDAADEEKLCAALGILSIEDDSNDEAGSACDGDNNQVDYVHNPEADELDLSILRGTKSNVAAKEIALELKEVEVKTDADLTALSELVPNLIDPKTKTIAQRAPDESSDNPSYRKLSIALDENEENAASIVSRDSNKNNGNKSKNYVSSDSSSDSSSLTTMKGDNDDTINDIASHSTQTRSRHPNDLSAYDVTRKSKDPMDADIPTKTNPMTTNGHQYDNGDARHKKDRNNRRSYVDNEKPKPPSSNNYNRLSSAASLSTVATHEVRMPMYLPSFKPATGCTNASDFIVRCFVARLRSGITVVKHGRSRWCKSRLRILHVHSDGRSLSWKPAVGEPSSSKRPPKLDLSTCAEVRHAWSSDPLNPMFTGTPILRQKCEAANAHKSFALIFPKRTVDVTAITADQCKVLMEGFSALCFRLQVANLAGKKQLSVVNPNHKGDDKVGSHSGSADEQSTASNTLTNNSTISPTTNAIRRSTYR